MATDDVKGSGLGLYFAERLMRAMGGSVEVKSPVWPEPHAPGARFSVRLPMADDVPDEEQDHLDEPGLVAG